MAGASRLDMGNALITCCPYCQRTFAIKARPDEAPLEQAFIERIPLGGWVVDGGACVGRLSLRIAATVGEQGRVLAIEPGPANFARLREAAKGTPVRPLACALHDHDGAGTLYLDGWSGSSHTLQAENCMQTAGSIPVELCTLDTLTKAWTRLDAIKLDVQGAELRVLTGAAKALAKWKPVLLVEMWPNGLRAFGDSPQAMEDYLSKFGYRRINADGSDASGPSVLGRSHQSHTDWLYVAHS